MVLNRPERGNALTGKFLAEIEQAALSLRTEADIRAVIVRGEGRHFSVGADLRTGLSRGDGEPAPLLLHRRQAEQGFRTLRALREIHQPTFCALHGVASGGGACIATACDFRIAHPEARLGYGEVRIGIPLMWRALPLCVDLVGPSRAKQLVMSGALYDAAVLRQWGLIDAVAEDLPAEVRRWAAEYAALPPLPVQMIKASVNAIADGGAPAVMHQDVDQWALASQSDDFSEAVQAFFEKRPGSFKGD
ncbi:MAG: enoyl-CoA hydratase/isomerase family protein [Gammaproteobacteria bacterium AqS3]|nr:enoyl-CoA hydratase/isomerase family protein [Gammaproteobacteria bacterium AqS3]